MDLQRFPHALLDDRFNRGMKHFCPKRFQSQLAQLEKCMSDVLSQNYQNEPNLKPERQINHRFIYIQKKWLSLQKSKCDFNVKRKKDAKKNYSPIPIPIQKMSLSLTSSLLSWNNFARETPCTCREIPFRVCGSNLRNLRWEGGNPPKWLNNFEDLRWFWEGPKKSWINWPTSDISQNRKPNFGSKPPIHADFFGIFLQQNLHIKKLLWQIPKEKTLVVFFPQSLSTGGSLK